MRTGIRKSEITTYPEPSGKGQELLHLPTEGSTTAQTYSQPPTRCSPDLGKHNTIHDLGSERVSWPSHGCVENALGHRTSCVDLSDNTPSDRHPHSKYTNDSSGTKPGDVALVVSHRYIRQRLDTPKASGYANKEYGHLDEELENVGEREVG